MTWFVADPVTRRSWGIPLPGERPGRDGALRKRVRNRTILVTGASSGVGRAAASRLGGAGASLILVARNEQELDAVAAEVEQAGGTAEVRPCDLSATRSVDRLLRQVGDRVEILVNNAGRSIRRSVRKSTERPHDFERTMQLNFHGALRVTLGVLPAMRERGHGHVVNVSSMGVQFAAPRFAAYVASKAALDAFSRVSAAELKRDGVVFTTVHLPLVRTPMIAPTKLYEQMPALSPEDAAGWICEAIISRSRSVDYPIGPVGEAMHAVVPAVGERLMSRIYGVGRLP